ncbi:MAG: hypothetical protein ACI87J_002263 [Colwellia sp.]|jgi:hypothetical protein
MIFNTTSPVLHKQILAMFPKAIKIVDHVIKEEKLLVGTSIVNHPNVPPKKITMAMLENDFPSLQESFFWYVI